MQGTHKINNTEWINSQKMKLLSTIILACIVFAGCNGKSKVYTDTSTGKTYTQEQWDELSADQQTTIRDYNHKQGQSETLIDRLLGNKILLLYAMGALLCVVCGIIAGYRGKIVLAICCGAGALACALLPACIAIFWQAGQIILYIMGAFLVVSSGVIIWWLWRRMELKHQEALQHKEALTGSLETVQEIKQAHPDIWDGIRDSIDAIQPEATKQAVKEFKKQ
jgi:hypothetical protein